MRLTSNKESVAKGEVSVLAIVETLLAIALVFYLSARFNTLHWLAFAMCVSPLLLLRTEESVLLGIRWFDQCVTWIERPQARAEGSWAGAFFALVGPPVIRFAATAFNVMRSPAEAFRQIPQNWSRVTLATDSRHPPEIIPGHPKETFQSLYQGEGPFKAVVLLLCTSPLYVPALVYRWSLKATSIIYAPLVFVAHSTFSENADLRTRLQLIKRGDLSRIRALYGVVAIIVFLIKLVLMMKWSGFVEVWKGNPIAEFLALYIAPAEIPRWQLAELANSVLAVGAMLFARQALLRYDLNHPLPEKPVKRI